MTDSISTPFTDGLNYCEGTDSVSTYSTNYSTH